MLAIIYLIKNWHKESKGHGKRNSWNYSFIEIWVHISYHAEKLPQQRPNCSLALGETSLLLTVITLIHALVLVCFPFLTFWHFSCLTHLTLATHLTALSYSTGKDIYYNCSSLFWYIWSQKSHVCQHTDRHIKILPYFTWII